MLEAHPNWAEQGSFWIGVAGLISVIAAVITLYFTRKQNSFSNVISCESVILSARTRLSEACVNEARAKRTPGTSDLDKEIAELITAEALESYLNTLDRLCAAVLRGDISEKVYRSDYRRLINGVMTDYQDKFGPSTPFRNVVAVYNKWADQ